MAQHKYFIKFKGTNFSKRQLMIFYRRNFDIPTVKGIKNLFIRDKKDKAIGHDENVWK